MKAFPIAAFAVLTLVAASPAFTAAVPQAPARNDPATELQALRERVDVLEREARANATLVANLQRYLEAQSKAAQAMQETLNASEKEGFTFGINPRSRETLLAGWREQLANLQKDLPAAKPTPPSAR